MSDITIPRPYITTGPVVMDAESRNALDHVAQCKHYRARSDAALPFPEGSNR